MSATGGDDGRGAGAAGLVGRDRELAVVEECVAALVAGRGGALWLEGEPGIGKSVLLDRAVGLARAGGARVWTAGAEAATRDLPLGVLAQCAGVSTRSDDPDRREIAGILRGTTTGTAGDPALLAGERIVELVEREALARPLVIAVDDVQWVDDVSGGFLARLLRLTGQLPVLLVTTARTGEAGLLRRSASSAGGVLVDVGPLSDGDLRRIALQRVPADRARLAEDLMPALAQAGGNPLYACELVDAASAGVGTDAPSTAGELPVRVRSVVDLRIGALAPEVQRLLEVAAVVGEPIDPMDVAPVSGTDLPQVLAGLAAATAAGIVVERDGELVFRHGLVREALLARTPAALQRALHGHLADQLRDEGATAGQVAGHLLAGPPVLAPWVAPWVESLPDSQLFAAHALTEPLLTRLVEAQPPGSPAWQLTAMRLARLRFWTGVDIRGFVEELVAAGLGVDDRADLAVMVCRLTGRAGDEVGAMQVVLDALALPGLSARARARLASWRAYMLVRQGDPGALDAVDTAVELAESTGDALVVAEAVRSGARGGDLTANLARLDAIPPLPATPEGALMQVLLGVDRLVVLHMLVRYDEFDRVLEQTLTVAESVDPALANDVRSLGVVRRYEQGRWDDAVAYVGAIEEDRAFLTDPQAAAFAAVISLRRGEYEGTAIPEALTVPGMPSLTAVAVGVLQDDEAALAELLGWLDMPRVNRVMAVDEAHQLARLAVRLGRHDVVDRVVELVTADAAEQPSAYGHLVPAAVRALGTSDVAPLAALVDAAEAGDRALWVAETWVDIAEAHARGGDLPAARAALGRAIALFEGMGAVVDVRRAEATLRAHGVRRGPRAAQRRATLGWAALTASEERVSYLVAQGLSNPDIAARLVLSRRTVESHVSNAMRKLGVSSRQAVAEHIPAASHTA